MNLLGLSFELFILKRLAGKRFLVLFKAWLFKQLFLNQWNKASEVSSNDEIRFSILSSTVKGVLPSAYLAISTSYAIKM